MAALDVLHSLVASAGLPPVLGTQVIGKRAEGLDNILVKAVLADDREVLLRLSKSTTPSPQPRATFLEAQGVGAPRLYSSDDSGAALVEFVPGSTLADLVATGADSDRIWRLTGAAFGRVHAVCFPAPLQGAVGPESIMLHPLDPVDQLISKINFSMGWVSRHRPNALPALGRLEEFVWRRAEEIRAETPCLVHGDANLLNIVVGVEQVTLIDWDFPAVRYPIDELSALDEHVYLNGATGLPGAFFDGYGREIPRDLLLAYRMVGCLNWLSSDDWDQWARDTTVPVPARNRLDRWHHRLVEWVDQMPQLSDRLIGS